jgi:hypothetical protein
MTEKEPKNTKHGLYSLRAKMYARSRDAVDQRSQAYRQVKAWRAEIVRDLGGPDALSAQRMTLLDLACKTRLFLDHLDS